MTRKKKVEVGARIVALLEYAKRSRNIPLEDIGWFTEQCSEIAYSVGGISLLRTVRELLTRGDNE